MGIVVTVTRPEARGSSAAGAALACLTWVVMVPWDFSEVDDQGRALDGGGDDNALLSGLVAVASCWYPASSWPPAPRPAIVRPRWPGLRGVGRSVRLAGVVANVSGDNMFVIPLLLLILPTAIAMPYLLRWVVARLARDHAD